MYISQGNVTSEGLNKHLDYCKKEKTMGRVIYFNQIFRSTCACMF